MDWAVIKPGLVEIIRSLASDDPEQPLPEGIVCWFDNQVSFISPETQTGIWLRIVSHDKRGRPGTTFVEETGPDGRVRLRAVRTKQEKFTLQVQANSLEGTDTNCGQVWIDRISDGQWDDSVLQSLRRLGLSIIRVRPTVEVTVKTPVDGSDGWDNRYVSAVSVDIVFHVVNIVQGRTVDYIADVAATGEVSGNNGAQPITLPEFEVV